MMTWTVSDLKGRFFSAVAVVSAENVETAIHWLQDELKREGLEQTVRPEQLIPMVTSTRKARILFNGDY